MHGEAAGHLQSKKPSPPLGLKSHCLGNGFLQPRECWGRAEVPQQELWQDRNYACARKQTGRAGAHSGRCVCEQTSRFLFSGLPVSCSCLPLAKPNQKRDVRGAPGMQPCQSASWALGRAEKGSDDLREDTDNIQHRGLLEHTLCISLLEVGHCLQTQRVMECKRWKNPEIPAHIP